MGLCYVRFTGLVFRQICNLPDSFFSLRVIVPQIANLR